MAQPSRFERLKGLVEQGSALLFGVFFVLLSFIVTLETLLRRIFQYSIQGADELSGYVLALGSTLAFTVALIGRTHIRVDLFYKTLGPRLKAYFNVLAIFSLAVFGVFLTWAAWVVLDDSLTYGSTAPTSWATPMVYPQAAWIAVLLLFAITALTFFIRALRYLSRGELSQLNREFSPRSASDELEEELQSIQERSENKREN